MFANGVWVYTLSIPLCAIAAILLNIRKPEYSVLEHTIGGAKVKRDAFVRGVIFVLMAYITFWAAIRNGVGDTTAYINTYNKISTEIKLKDLFFGEEGESLFALYQIILKRLGFSWQIYLASIAIISGICVYKGISKYSDDVALSYFFYITGLYYSWMYNGIRQFLVAAIVFANFKLIVEKKLWNFLLLIFVLYFVHNTAWILIPVYFIANMKNWSYGIYVCILATMAVVILFPNQFTALLDDSFEEYNVAEQFAKDDGVNIFRFLVSMVTPALAFAYKDKIAEYKNPYVNVLVNLSLISAGLYAVGVVTSGIYMGRLPLYSDMFGLILLPFILKRVLPKNSRNVIWVVSIILYLVFFYLQINGTYYTTNWFSGMDMGGAQLY